MAHLKACCFIPYITILNLAVGRQEAGKQKDKLYNIMLSRDKDHVKANGSLTSDAMHIEA